MKSRFIILLLAVFSLNTVFAEDLPPRFKERGLVGIVIPSAPKQVPTGDFRSILDVLPDSPSAQAGIKPGDYILSIDGQSTAAMKTYIDLVHALQGAPGTPIRLELRRIKDGRAETLTITRSKTSFVGGGP